MLSVLQVIGNQVVVKIVKNKLAPPFRTAEFLLEFGKGICRVSELIELGLKHKFITKTGGAFYSMNNQSFRGKDAIKTYLVDNISVREDLAIKLREKLFVDQEKEAVPEAVDGNPIEEVISSDNTDEEVAICN